MMSYENLMCIHLTTVLPAFVLVTISLLIKKGTSIHKNIGRVYMILMLFTAIVTLIYAGISWPSIFKSFWWIHFFSFLTIYSVPSSYIAIRKGNIKRHKRGMISLYFGALIIAGGFTLVPGRYLHSVIFG